MKYLKTYELFNFKKKQVNLSEIYPKISEISLDCFQDIKDEGFRVDSKEWNITTSQSYIQVNIHKFKSTTLYDHTPALEYDMFNFSEIKSNVLQFYNMVGDYYDIKNIESHMVDPDLKWGSIIKYFPMSKYGHLDPKYKDIMKGRCDDIKLKMFTIKLK